MFVVGDDMKIYEIEGKCPKCGSPLIRGGNTVWCTFVGDSQRGVHGCDFALDLHQKKSPEPIAVNDIIPGKPPFSYIEE